MDKQFFINAGIPPQFDQPILPTWHSDLHFPAIQSSDCFFDSAISSMVSSPVSTSNSNESFVIRELIGKLGNICNPGEISPPEINQSVSVAGALSTYVSANNSCYSTPMSSPPKMNIGTINRAIMENFNTHLGNSMNVPSIGSNLPSITGDPGFVERAARFSSFGSRSFNGRNTQFPCPNGSELSTRFTGSGKLQRVSSSPTINVSQMAENRNSITNESGSRKRKSQPKGKCREIPCSSPPKVLENGDDSNSKRSKLNDESKNSKTEQKLQEEEDESKNQKPPEAPKDYIHVRARRGQATDSHSLAERVRREKISERMKLLQDLVPGCNKVTGKALMLEEIINYVQSLQRQVEFLSMKLSTVNSTSMDLNTNNHFHKNAFEPNSCMQTQEAYPLDNLTPTLYGGHQDPQNHLQQNGITSNGMDPHFPNPMDPMNQSHNMQLPTTNGFNNGVPQLCEGDLHTIVQMGFTHNSTTFEPQSLQGGSNEAPTMKAEF